jgi:hypothetical protein
MAFVLADRVKETCAAPGTGTVTLLGAATGYQAFSAGIGANNITYYTIADQGGANWEVGIGTIGAGGTTLARTTVLASSNSGSLVNFSSGTQDVFCDYPAAKAVYVDNASKLKADGNNYFNFPDGNGTTTFQGRMWYNNNDGSWNLGMGGGNITQQVGEELFVYGKATATIADSPLQIVYKTGVIGASGVITFAPTVSGITNSNLIVGVATEAIASGSFGRVSCFGIVHDINTTGSAYGETWAAGDVIWYNPTTGNPTKTKPTAPNIKMQIGTVINANATQGCFQVELIHGTELGGTDSNVNISSPTGGQLLTYDQTDSYWKNTSLSAGTGISVTPTTGGAITVANTGVTSVTGTAPVVSSGGTTPAISMAAANGSTNGYLTSTDWTTFNNKGSGTVTSVTATSPVTSTGGATPVIAMPAATGSVNGYLTSTDWTTFNNKGSGTVTSVGLSAPAIFTVGSSPVTGSGTISLTYSGTALPIANGGTNQTAYTAPSGNVKGLVYYDGTSFANDTTVTDAGYDTSTNTLNSRNFVANNGMICNSMTVSSNFSIPSGFSAMAAGPMTVSSGVTVTIPSGSRWVVL